jgi:transcription elongation GreA/GreB family factor
MNSKVTFRDHLSHRETTVEMVYPEKEDAELGNVSGLTLWRQR